jgi:hypothetical protein
MSDRPPPKPKHDYYGDNLAKRAHWPAWLSNAAIGAGFAAFVFIVAPLLIVAAGAASRAVYYLFMIGWGQ